MKLSEYIRNTCSLSIKNMEHSSLYGPLYAHWTCDKNDDIREIENFISDHQPKTILEYGVGYGRVPFNLNSKGIIYHGVEINNYFLDLASSYFRECYDGSVEISIYGSDAKNESLLIPSDLIICTHNFINEIHSSDLESLFLNISNNLNECGKVYIKTITPYPYERVGIVELVGSFIDKEGLFWTVSVVKDPNFKMEGNNMLVFFDAYNNDGMMVTRKLKQICRHIHTYEKLDFYANKAGLKLHSRRDEEGICIYEHY